MLKHRPAGEVPFEWAIPMCSRKIRPRRPARKLWLQARVYEPRRATIAGELAGWLAHRPIARQAAPWRECEAL